MATQTPALTALCGSLRRDSFNRKLLAQAVASAERQGATVDVVDLKALALPVYDGDLEADSGLPAGAVELKARIGAAGGLLVASPEYNHSIPGAFKNAIDWATRGGGNPFADKVIALMGASTGPFGAVRSVQHLRQVFMARAAWIVPTTVLLANAGEAFDDDGRLRNEATQTLLDAAVKALLSRL